jgi:cholesterol oxidase
MFDVRVNPDITVIKGCGLGGGSLINANVGLEPEENVFTDPCWPKALRDDAVTLQKAFSTVHDMLKTTTLPGSVARCG